jgi:hypothetical protein
MRYFFVAWDFKVLLNYSKEQNPSWEANRFSTSQEIPHHFMGSEVSLPPLQEPATFPYPEPDKFSPSPRSLHGFQRGLVNIGMW